ncbi:MAG TPA: enolase C-terminal domain-like protein [Solirubrobacteraceae bacterium]|nr:enolase C-terminal domain-like protein [Solirubrobacteraceae bacterium]
MRDCEITDVEIHDVRFPTSRTLAGSDAMNEAPDYSAAYVILHTDTGERGHGMTFTVGRGTEIVVAAVHALAPLVKGRRLADIAADQRGFWRSLAGDPHLRWVGPEKGVIHLATAAVVNAVWDLWARSEDKPLWKLVSDMTPAELVACIDFRYMTDVLTPERAIEMLGERAGGRSEREAGARRAGLPAYTTSVGWLGYSDDDVRRRCREAVEQGWTHMKMKVGGRLEDDVHRAALIREEIGAERFLMMDANQVWEVEEAITATRRLAEFDPWWMEEPTSPDDVLGHARIAREVAPVRIATGEHCQNRTMFKQLMQAGALHVCQLDACRLGGVNEVLAVLLLAARFGIPVCPHAGGVGLSEYVQHLSLIDYIVLGGELDDRRIEYVDELHEHFVAPVQMSHGRYLVPETPGYSIEMRPQSVEEYAFPDGAVWADPRARA